MYSRGSGLGLRKVRRFRWGLRNPVYPGALELYVSLLDLAIVSMALG
jgi:hypothetical protein